MAKRKIHNTEAGYVAERMNPFVPGKKVVIYVAEEQGIDVDGLKYAVVCDAHGTICGESSIPRARVIMKNPHNFCEDCQASEDVNQSEVDRSHAEMLPLVKDTRKG